MLLGLLPRVAPIGRLEAETGLEIAYRLWMEQPNCGIVGDLTMSRHAVRRFEPSLRLPELRDVLAVWEAPNCPRCAS